MKESKLLIAQLTPYYFPSIGGVEAVVQYIAEDLVRRGHEVHVLTSNRNHKGYPPLKRPRREVINGVQICRFRTYGSIGHLGFFPGIIPALLREGYDIIHSHCYRHPHGEIGSIIGRLKHLHTILHVHGGFFASDKLKSLLYKVYDHLAAKHFVNCFDHYIVLSHSFKETLHRLNIASDKISIIQNAVPDEYFNAVEVVSFREKHGLQGKRVLLFLSSLHSYKRPDLLISALPKIIETVPNVFLLFVGPDAGEYAKVEKLTRDLKLTNHVKWLGPLQGKEKQQAFEVAELFILPSDEEPFGLVFLEAMAHGKPVIGTDTEGARKIIDHNETGLIVNRGRADEIAEVCLQLLSNPSQAEKMGRKAKERASIHYRVPPIVDQVEHLYYRLINEKKENWPD